MKPEIMNTEEQNQEETAIRAVPDKAEYLQRIREMSERDQAFLEGFLYAKVTDVAKGA